jgi:hypothetical protein
LKDIKKFINQISTVLKSLGLNTIIFSFLTTIFLLLIHQLNDVKSPIITLFEKICEFEWSEVRVTVVFLVLLVVFLLIVKFSRPTLEFIKKIYSFNYITILDKIIASLLFGLILYRGMTLYWLKDVNFIVDYYVLMGILSINFSFRIYKVSKLEIKKHYNIGFISDIPAKEDLLNRGNIVESLTNSIKGVSVEGSFVIGMYGEWGEGKTTILNMVEEKLKLADDTHVIRFEPWYYNSMDAIIKNFFDLICETLGKKHLSLDLIILISDYRDLLLNALKGLKANKVAEMLIPNFSSRQNINNIKNKIEEKLKKLDQKVVIFIDDLDRMERNEILLVFKLVKLFSDFNNFIYVLSFDRKRVERILIREMTADKSYLDKIIQVGFELPKVPNETLTNILIKFLDTFISQFEIKLNQDTIRKIQRIVPEISVLFDDVRKIKRFYNLLCIKYPMAKEKINFYDYFVITVIEFLFPVQFEEIYKHKNKFVYYLSDMIFRREDISKERKNYYDDFFAKVKDEEKKKILKKLLSSIFTSISYYEMGYGSLVSNYAVNYDNLQNKSIEDSKFFDYYFTFEKNDFMLMNDKIEEFILILNHGEDFNEINQKFESLVRTFSSEEQVTFFQNFKGYIKNIGINKYSLFVRVIYNNSFLYDDKHRGFMQLSAYSHAEAIVADVIRATHLDKIKRDLLEDVVIHCNDLEFARGVLYFSKRHAEENLQFNHIKEDCINLFKKRIKKKYLEDEANIFLENQKAYGMWVFANYIDDKKQLADYYYKMIEREPKNIIKFLSIFRTEVTSYSPDDSWTEVTFNSEFFTQYFDKEKINKYVQSYKNQNNLNKKEEELIKLFEDFYNGKLTENIYM